MLAAILGPIAFKNKHTRILERREVRNTLHLSLLTNKRMMSGSIDILDVVFLFIRETI